MIESIESPAVALAIGDPCEGGGFYAGQIRINGEVWNLAVAPKDLGDKAGKWNSKTANVTGACSYCDGLANTEAMVKAGSQIAKWARGLKIGEHADWYIPSRDELEVIYRNLKPTAVENDRFNRSGENPSAVPPTYPYSPLMPAPTPVALFADEGAQAFEEAWYWSSTQYSADGAWDQTFDFGNQVSGYKSYEGRARAVRRFKS